jgi:hypothetical protein
MLTAEVQREKFLEADNDDIRSPPFAGEKTGDLERRGEPINKVLWETQNTLKVRVVGRDLYQQPINSGCHFERPCQAVTAGGLNGSTNVSGTT